MPKDKRMKVSAISVEKMRITCPKCGEVMEASLVSAERAHNLFPCKCPGCELWWGDDTERYELWSTFEYLRSLKKHNKKMQIICPTCGSGMEASLNSEQILNDLIPCICLGCRTCRDDYTERYELRFIVEELWPFKKLDGIACCIGLEIVGSEYSK